MGGTKTIARLQNKVALVTGAAQGIGAHLARALAVEGAKVVLGDILDTAKAAASIQDAGGAAFGTRLDVTSNADLDATVKAAEARFGPIEILVNNASIFAALRLKPFTSITEDEWDRVMAVNARGPFQCAKAVVPSMVRNGRGKIVNISSGTFLYGAPGFMHYVASKGAVIGITRAMARELGEKNITVNAITPGLTESEGVKEHADLHMARAPTIAGRAIKRDMLPGDLVGAVLFLAAPDSDFLTGQTINVDGGRLTY